MPPTPKIDKRKSPDPNGCKHLLLPGSYCFACHAEIPARPRRIKRA